MRFLILCLKFKFASKDDLVYHKLKMSSSLSQIFSKYPYESNNSPKGLAQFMHIIMNPD